ncbi:hypothetical protein GR212_15605 [Rhizobium lusitanum]|uniref:Uncharacterized protein n=1 Tax=Rhizobium lusitanum TaxID=293958 RepID=A0A6L9U6U0_9HYPH|nr:hypothetical protein [Rhizobium lusitanum]
MVLSGLAIGATLRFCQRCAKGSAVASSLNFDCSARKSCNLAQDS